MPKINSKVKKAAIVWALAESVNAYYDYAFHTSYKSRPILLKLKRAFF